jgi:serine protease Do
MKDVYSNQFKDLALIRMQDRQFTFNYARIGRQPSYGDFVRAVGFPLSFDSVITKGYVAQFVSNAGIKGLLLNMQISPGNSGGGLFDRWGNLVGINEASYSIPSPVVIYGFAINVEEIKKFLKEASESDPRTQ